MKVNELIALLQKQDQDAEILIELGGSIYPTATIGENVYYNSNGGAETEFFIVANVEFED
jgi:hypothetical protein